MIIAKCVQLNNDGWDSYEELELGKTYEVDYADVGRCHTCGARMDGDAE